MYSKGFFFRIGNTENTSSASDVKFTRLECEIDCKVKLGIL